VSLPEFKLLRPRTVEEAIQLLQKHAPNVQIVAGGTDLIPSMRQGLFAPEYVLDMRGISELRGIGGASRPRLSGANLGDTGLEIGALTTLREIERSEFIRVHYPVLYQAARVVASPILRNMGTIGGNICLDTRCLWYNQSLAWRKSCGFCIKKDGDLCHVAPGGTRCWAVASSDTPPALLCLDAEVEIAGLSGLRLVPVRELYTSDGAARIRLGRNELLTRVILPRSKAGWRGAYRKLRIRGSIDYPLAGVAVALRIKMGDEKIQDARVAITAVNPAPMLVEAAALIGRSLDENTARMVGELAAKTSKPLTTSALTPEYRREMVRVFAKRAVLECGGKATADFAD
jgi:4-hydroxybenzoyl-CoA reductase subunit beta